jgi:hypothetical protein
MTNTVLSHGPHRSGAHSFVAGVLLQLLAAIFALGFAVMLSACTPVQPVATFQTGGTVVSLVRSKKGDSYFIDVGTSMLLPLEGYTSARVESIWNMSQTTLAIISGGSGDCRLRYTAVVAFRQTARIYSIGDCGGAYNLAQDGDAISIRQTGIHNDRVWILRNGVLEGPIAQTAPSKRRRNSSPRGVEAAPQLVVPPVSKPVGAEVIPSPAAAPGPSEIE